ncbi:Lengsin [Dactylellina cionopaga]|nr:Lengsin [Dactylellina cionopaga]
MTAADTKFAAWEDFLSKNSAIEFVWLQFLTYTSRLLTRMVPVAKFTQMVKTSQHFAVPLPAWSLGPGHQFAEGASPCGILHLCPDVSTAYCQAGSEGTRAVIQCDCLNLDLTPFEGCPRSRLRVLHDTLRCKMGLSALVGFEIEVVFMKSDEGVYTPINQDHHWGCVSAEDYVYISLIEDIARALRDVGIPLEHFHPESAPGQWEFVLPPDAPIRAVDTLLKARDTITNIARSHGVRATLHPRVSQDHAPTGAHVHISVNDLGNHDPRQSESFFAGVTQHLPSILALTLPQDISYERVKAGTFSGGEYACWGWENKEVALRRITENRFELKLMDGLANPYLALSAILSAGLDGLSKKMPLRAGSCSMAPTLMSSKERDALGVNVLLPKTLESSLAALEANEAIGIHLGDVLVSTYLAVKRKEMEYLQKMTDEERKSWIISTY